MLFFIFTGDPIKDEREDQIVVDHSADYILQWINQYFQCYRWFTEKGE